MSPQLFNELKENIISQLKSHLLPVLYYHSAGHTLDVVASAEQIGKAEKITEKEMSLLKTAALFHDTGYLFTAKNHEENSCRIAEMILPKYGFTESDIVIITELIMATKVPHHPKNKLEEIICDADLDYLGRKDFPFLSKELYKEMKMFDKVSDETKWNEMQIVFFEKHHYFTDTSKTLRAPEKEKHLQHIRSMNGSRK